MYSVKKIENTEEKEKSSYYFFETKDYVTSVDGEWKIASEKIKGSKILHRAVAIPVKEQNSFGAKNVYSFFVVRKEYSPFPVYFHSTFKLNEHRDEIVEKENPKTINRFIARELLSYYVEKVKEHFLTPEFGDYAMQLLTPNGFEIKDGCCEIRESFFKDFNLLNEYVEKIRSIKFIYTVNNEFISDSPEVINCEEIPNLFKAPYFERLIDSDMERADRVLPFLRKYFGLRDLTPEEICKRINEMAPSLIDDSVKRMSLFYWWKESVCKTYFEEERKDEIYYPNIVKTDAQCLTNDVKNCYLTGGAVQEPPKWATITVIDPKDEENLSILYAEKINKIKRYYESFPKKIRLLLNEYCLD